MSLLCVNWITLRDFSIQRNVSIQWILVDEITYRIRAYDGVFGLDCTIPLDGNSDQVDFETNFKNNGNKSPYTQVTTQYELNDKVLKLARGCASVDNTGKAVIYFKIPGAFGSGAGRFLTGGYGISEDYNKDDYVVVNIEDKDRIIAWMIAKSIDPNAVTPVADAFVQQMGVIPGIGLAFPVYPEMESYTDEDVSPENRGWYFWPLAQGNNLPPVGEVEINPIGGYGFAPGGFYLVLIYQRPSGIITGSFRANYDWGKRG